MLKNYFTIAFRNILKNKLNTATNIIGLAIGLSVCLLVLLYVFHEFSYEKEVPDAKRIYQVYRMDTWNNITTKTARNSPHLAEELKNRMPEIENACEFVPTEFPLIEDGKINKSISVIVSDKSFLSIFSIRLLKGSLSKALVEPNSIIVSKDFAKSLSKNLDVIGKAVILKTRKGNEEFKITGVSLPIKGLTHLNFEAIISKDVFHFILKENTVEWNTIFSYCFIKLRNDHPEQLQEKFPEFMKTFGRENISLGLFPLLDLHLKSDLNGQLSGTGSIKYVYILISITVLLLIISNSNVVSLTAANYFKRIKEIGVRKTVGAGKKSLFAQFLIENMLIVFFSFFIAIFLTEIFLPDFNNLLKTKLSMSFIENVEAFLLCFLLTFILGCVTTFYISHLTAKQKSANLISGRILNVNAKSATRKLLITCQFVIAIFLLCCMIIIWQQILFIKHKDLGFNRDQVLIIQSNYEMGNHYKAFINDLKNFSGTEYVSAADWFPGEGMPTIIRYEKNDKNITVGFINIDENFIPSLNIKIKEGRNFDSRLGDESKNWIINGKAVEALGIKDPNNKFVKMSGMEGMVIGIIPDINISSLKESTGPVVFQYIQSEPRLIGIKIKPGKIIPTLQFVHQKWSEYSPFSPLRFSFVDETLNNQYTDDNRLFNASIYSSVLSFIISLMGIFALTSINVENRTKEIGVRKVLGASIPSILLIFSKEFVKWIILANIIAIPFAYYFINNWLQDFTYRIEISWWMFVLSGGIALVIALTTVGIQAVKAATANPVESLRYE